MLLLAGEIVAGGKQDRVIGKDRIVPAESDPVDLGVFCVEPGRWVATSEQFGTSGSMYGMKAGSGGGVIGDPGGAGCVARKIETDAGISAVAQHTEEEAAAAADVEQRAALSRLP